MKNPLHYQLSEYDCGPTTMLNAISFLFEREEISPVVIRNVMLYCLDSYNGEGSRINDALCRGGAVIIFNEKTKKAAEATIEYYI